MGGALYSDGEGCMCTSGESGCASEVTDVCVVVVVEVVVGECLMFVSDGVSHPSSQSWWWPKVGGVCMAQGRGVCVAQGGGGGSAVEEQPTYATNIKQ